MSAPTSASHNNRKKFNIKSKPSLLGLEEIIIYFEMLVSVCVRACA
jgi:hypothetical protein